MPLPAGVAGFESETFSAIDAGAAGKVVEVPGDSSISLGGVSSLTDGGDGSRMARSLSGETVSVTRPGDDLAPDFRRSLEAPAVVLPDGAIAMVDGCRYVRVEKRQAPKRLRREGRRRSKETEMCFVTGALMDLVMMWKVARQFPLRRVIHLPRKSRKGCDVAGHGQLW